MKYVYTVYGSEDGIISIWSSFPKASDAGMNYVQNARQGQYFDIMVRTEFRSARKYQIF